MKFLNLFLGILIVSAGCSSDDDTPMDPNTEENNITITVKDFEVTIDENPDINQNLGTIEATTNQGSVEFSIASQNPQDAFAIEAATGNLTVKDPTLFDYEARTQLTATIVAKNGETTKEAKVTITLNDIRVEVINGNIQFPDPNFKTALLKPQKGIIIDTNDDGEISVDEAKVVSIIRIGGEGNTDNISDISGIEFFTSLSELRCSFSKLTSIDVSANTALISLNIEQNQITALDISKNVNLTTLTCSGNQIATLDVSSNTALNRLYCHNNQLTQLDISKNIELTNLLCMDNQLTDLDIISNNKLSQFWCYNNQLATLSMNNGNNAALTDVRLGNNTPLKCIQVDDPSAGYLSSWIRDKGTHFAADCSIR